MKSRGLPAGLAPAVTSLMLNITQVPEKLGGPIRSKNLQAPTEVSCKMRRNQGRGTPGRGFTTTTPEPGGHAGEEEPERLCLFLLLLHQLISLTKGTEVGNSSEPGDPKKCYVGSHLGASAQSPNGTRGSCRTSSSPASFCPYKKVCQTNQSSRTQQLGALWNRGGQRKAGGSPSPGPNERGTGRGRKQSPEPPAPEPWL